MKKPPDFPKLPPVLFVRITDRFRQLFLHLYRRFTHPSIAVFEMIHQFWLASALGVAAELGLADLLKTGNKSVGELARLTGTDENSLYRILRMLAANDVFREVNGRVFTLTPLARSLQEDQVKYLITSHLSKFHYEMFGELSYTVRTGKKASELFINSPFYEHIGEDSDKAGIFNKAMTSVSMLQMAAILPVFPFRKFSTIVDVGGGEGLLLAAILARCPKSSGTVFDLPQTSPHSRQIFEEYGVSDRASFVPGSFFEKITEGGDLYILKNVLHNWDDDSCLKILRKVYSAMAPSARLLLIETFIEEQNKPSFGKMTDVLMMVSVGGKERTMEEFSSLLTGSGFGIKKVYRTVSPIRLMEAYRL